MSVVSLMRENIRNLEPYKCARDEAGGGMRVYLDANENYAPLTGWDGINRYPDSASLELRQAFSRVSGFPAHMLVAGNGSDELIDLLIRIFCNPGKDCVLVFPPTYGEYSVLASINDVKVVTCPLNEDFSLNADAACDAVRRFSPKLVFFCSPNNPSGNLIDRKSILDVAAFNPGITVVDQAYADFAVEGAFTADDIMANERLVVLRTLSKAWALAGARCGFMAAGSEIAQKAYDVKYPYNVSLLTSSVAVSALEDVEGCRRRIAEIKRNRKLLMDRLRKLDGVRKVFDSDANFFLVRFDDPVHVYNELKKKGVVVRDRSSQLHCDGCLRITVGSQAECDELVSSLEEIL